MKLICIPLRFSRQIGKLTEVLGINYEPPTIHNIHYTKNIYNLRIHKSHSRVEHEKTPRTCCIIDNNNNNKPENVWFL